MTPLPVCAVGVTRVTVPATPELRLTAVVVVPPMWAPCMQELEHTATTLAAMDASNVRLRQAKDEYRGQVLFICACVRATFWPCAIKIADCSI